MCIPAYCKAHLELFLIKNSVIVTEKVQTENPKLHCIVCHNPELAKVAFTNDVALFGQEILYAIYRKCKVGEAVVILAIVTVANHY